MPGILTPPELRRELQRLADRVSNLERRLQKAGRQDHDSEAVFSHADAPAPNVPSPRWRVKGGGILYHVLCSLGTAGTTATVVTIYKTGVTIGTVTIEAGNKVSSDTFDVRFSPDDDDLRVAATTVGTGAEDLTVQCRFR